MPWALYKDGSPVLKHGRPLHKPTENVEMVWMLAAAVGLTKPLKNKRHRTLARGVEIREVEGEADAHDNP